ncbi:hypothetical protein [Sphingomonas phage Birtae]|nr:hypothetical protein [Sphingomonas phage Birtae]
MAERRPIVLLDGRLQELPTGDTLPGGGSGGSGAGLPSLVGNAGKKLRVNAAETAAEWGYDFGIFPKGPQPHGAHRYWRVTPMLTDDNRYAQIATLIFRGVPNGPQLATGGTAIESGHYGSNVAANAFDGSETTVWEGNAGAGSAPSGNIWVGYDFLVPVAICEIEMRMHVSYETDERPRAGWVHYSDDGLNWVAAWPFGQWTWSDLVRVSTSPFYASTIPTPYIAKVLHKPIFDFAVGDVFGNNAFAGTSVFVDEDAVITGLKFAILSGSAGKSIVPGIYANSATNGLGALLATGPAVAMADNSVIVLPLTAPLAVSANQKIWIGVAGYGSGSTFNPCSLRHNIPQRYFGYTGAAALPDNPASTSAAGSNLPVWTY